MKLWVLDKASVGWRVPYMLAAPAHVLVPRHWLVVNRFDEIERLCYLAEAAIGLFRRQRLM